MTAREDVPKITPEEVEASIANIEYHVFPGTLLTVCCLTLTNGFNVIGQSACAHPDLFNDKIGRQVSYNQAKGNIWQFLGYALKEKLSKQ